MIRTCRLKRMLRSIGTTAEFIPYSAAIGENVRRWIPTSKKNLGCASHQSQFSCFHNTSFTSPLLIPYPLPCQDVEKNG